jgi:exo-1,4-beta-D-glucosaminidase
MSRITLTLGLFAVCAAGATAQSRLSLNQEWRIHSSDGLTVGGAEISSPRFRPESWIAAHVPSTVVAALASDGKYGDPYYGTNLRSIPGTTYDFGDNFAVDPMPSNSPFRASWWYRTQFRLPGGVARRSLRASSSTRYWLHFDSINYRANIWLNGRRIAGENDVRGMYRTFEFDATDFVRAGINTIAVEVFAPTENDLSISFVDWNPLPADKDMGLVRDVYLLETGPVAVGNLQVGSTLNAALDRAAVTVSADLTNGADAAVEGTVTATIGDVVVNEAVQLAARESRQIRFAPIAIDQPRIWWPAGMGAQELYRAHVEFRSGGVVSDGQDAQFGIRTVASELDANQHRLFRVNGKRILIRGAAWTPDMMLRISPEREAVDLRYAREMNLNALRFEGKLEMTDGFFDLADRMGILLLPGWCCCSAWEQWDTWTPSDYLVAAESLRTQVRRLRNHPSVLAFLYGSDNAPPPQAEQAYLRVFAEENWPNPYIAAARDETTPGAGRTGVKMLGPYDYVPPEFWLADGEHGGGWGFNTETSPGPAIPELASLRQMMPKADLWPPDNPGWNFHAGSGSFADTRVFNAALDGRYGKAKDLADYVRKSQAMTYEAQRAMFEAYGRNKYTAATGVIQWLMNSAWPGLTWHLYDWYFRASGGYFGTKKALEPAHVQFSYDDRSIVVVNSRYEALPGHTVTAKVYNLDLTEKFSRSQVVDVAADSATRIFTIPAIDGLSRTYFVRLSLDDAAGHRVSSNFYWLSTQADVMDWPNLNYRYVPITTYMDLSGLDQLPPAVVTASWVTEQQGEEQLQRVTVRNVSGALAFLVRLTLLRGKDGADVAPAYWSDNYFELMPGEERQLTVTYPSAQLGGAPAYVRVGGWNVAEQ